MHKSSTDSEHYCCKNITQNQKTKLPDQVSQKIELHTFAANHSKSETSLPELYLTTAEHYCYKNISWNPQLGF